MNIPNEVIYNIFNYLEYKDLLNLKLINKNINNIVTIYDYDKYKIYIKKNKCIKKNKIYKQIEEIVYDNILEEEIKIKELNIHEYKLFVKNFNYKYMKYEIDEDILIDLSYMLIIHFSFGYNNKYHILKGYIFFESKQDEDDYTKTDTLFKTCLYYIKPYTENIIDEKVVYNFTTNNDFKFMHKIFPEIESILLYFIDNDYIIDKIKKKFENININDEIIDIVDDITSILNEYTKNKLN